MPDFVFLVSCPVVQLVSERGLAALTLPALSRSQTGLIVAILGLSVMLMISARRRRGVDGHSPRAYAREHLARLREEGEIKEDMEELLARVQEAARDLNAQLDTRFHKLERVIRDADARTARLERLIRAADGKPVCDITVSEDGSKPAEVRAKSDALGVNSRYTTIYDLAATGRSAVEIAQTTGQTPGEVELILALQPKCLV